MIRAGTYELYSIQTGTIRLDGGAMFGVVPKVLWSKTCDVDEQNRILLATRTLLAVNRDTATVILTDTGCGSKWSPEQADRYGIRHDDRAIDSVLEALGYTRASVTDVIITHLHFDHNGGLCDWVNAPGGPTQLRYPAARHWIHRQHLEHARQPFAKDRASFLPHDFEVLDNDDRLRLVEGESGAAPDGVKWEVSHGHTPWQLHPVFGDKPRQVLFTGDIIPTKLHLRQTWVMAYDVEPLRTIKEKSAMIRRGLEEGAGLVFPHDPELGGAAIDGTVERPVISGPLDLTGY